MTDEQKLQLGIGVALFVAGVVTCTWIKGSRSSKEEDSYEQIDKSTYLHLDPMCRIVMAVGLKALNDGLYDEYELASIVDNIKE